MTIALTRNELLALKEDDLSRQVLVPLFTAMGYRDVRFNGGQILEQGKDLTMWRNDPARGRINVAAVVKAVPITGQSSSVNVVTQLEQAFGVPFIDVATGTEEYVHECFVVTPHEIKKEGTFTVQKLLASRQFRHYVTLLDGVRLWELVQQHLGPRATLGAIIEKYRHLNSRPDLDIGLQLEKKSTSVSIRTATGAPIVVPLPIFADTPEGALNLERFKEFIRTGTLTVIDLEHVVSGFESLVLGDLAAAERVGAQVTLRSCLPNMSGELRCRTADGVVAVPGVIMSGYAGTQQMTLTNLDQRHPIHFRTTITFANEEKADFGLGTTVAGNSIFWYVRMLELLQKLAVSTTIAFFEYDTGIEHPLGSNAPLPASDLPETAHLDLARRVLAVQNRLRIPILMPDRPFFTDDDVFHLENVESVLATGRLRIDSFSVPMTAGNESMSQWRSRFTEPVREFSADFRDFERPVLDTMLPLGAARLELTDVRYIVDNTEVALAALERGDTVKVTIAPAESDHFDLVFPRWIT